MQIVLSLDSTNSIFWWLRTFILIWYSCYHIFTFIVSVLYVLFKKSTLFQSHENILSLSFIILFLHIDLQSIQNWLFFFFLNQRGEISFKINCFHRDTQLVVVFSEKKLSFLAVLWHHRCHRYKTLDRDLGLPKNYILKFLPFSINSGRKKNIVIYRWGGK